MMSSSSVHASGRLCAQPGTVATLSRARPSRHALGIGGQRDGAVFIPAALDPAKPAPLIVGLHGAGGVASQMLDLLVRSAETKGVILLAPESRASTWDVIRGGYGPDVAFIDEALRQVFRMHPVDPARIAVSGFSDGASYALSLGVINGGLFSHVLAFSPGFLIPTGAEDRPKVFVSHGIHDDVLPIGPCSRRIVPALEAAGYDVEYREFDGGHVVPREMVDRAVARFLG